MAKKPPPEPIDHHYNILRLTQVLAIASLIFAGPVTYLTVKQDYDRDWKDWQKKFLKNDRARTRAARDLASTKIDPDTELAYIEKVKEGKREIRKHHKAYEKALAHAKKCEGAWYDADQVFRFNKADMDTARYTFEVAQKENPKAATAKKAQERLEKLQAVYEKSQVVEQRAQKTWNEAKAAVAAIEKTRTDAEEALKKLSEDYDRFQAKLKTLKNDAFFQVRNAPIADMLAPSLTIQQVQLDGLWVDMNFLKSQRIDRCMTCHIAADKRGFEDKEKYPEVVLRTHPRLDLFVDSNSPHPYATFGCTSCHLGRDRATDFTRAGHMPDDFQEYETLHLKHDKAATKTQTAQWIKKYGWEIDKYNDLPMLPMKAVEAGCFRCHKNDAGHVKAPKLDEGRKLVENLGCWGCHKMSGFENLPRVGPSLAKVAAKTTPDWTGRWLANPKAFRSNTKMPRFFGLENFEKDHDLTDTMIASVVAYLFEKSEKGAHAAPAAGSAERGKLLFESLGCQGCHISDSSPTVERHVMDGWRQHGPNLIGLAEKVSPGWLAAWLKDPKAYNPETRMPNLRLADDEISDLAAFLLTRPAPDAFKATPVPQADDKRRDERVRDYLRESRSNEDAEKELAKLNAHQKDVFLGERIIAHYGCYACHNIPGFEKAKPIGVELSEWGNKAVHLLDFGFVEVPHTRVDWFQQKVSEPRSYDRQKVKSFQEKLKMPQFGLSAAEIRALQSTVLGFQKQDMSASLVAQAVGDRGAIEAGRKLVKEYNCQGCHILEERGGQIRETLSDVALAPPNIKGEGAKVQSDWLFSFVNAPKNGQIRPWLKVRMPTFEMTPAQLNTLTRYFATLDKAPFPFERKIETLEARSRAAGAASFAQLQCANCHPTSTDAVPKLIAGGKTMADLAPILSAAHTRLRYDWIADWIKRPDEWMPGTRMPTNFPMMEGKRISPLAPALDTPMFADYKKQLIAIWGTEAEAKAYLADPERVTQSLRDHVWSLGNEFVTAPAEARRAPATRAEGRAPKGAAKTGTATGGK